MSGGVQEADGGPEVVHPPRFRCSEITAIFKCAAVKDLPAVCSVADVIYMHDDIALSLLVVGSVEDVWPRLSVGGGGVCWGSSRSRKTQCQMSLTDPLLYEAPHTFFFINFRVASE